MKAFNKNIVVTGGGNGVGRQLVLELLSKGATVIAVDKNQMALNETIEISGNNSRLYTHAVDISNIRDVVAFTDEAVSKYKNIDGLINCAGIIQPFLKLEELELDHIDRVMNVNFYGTLYMTKSFLPFLKERPESHLINISSMGGFLPVPGQGIYGASKAAVKVMTEALHSELANTTVNVTVVFPGGVATDIKINSEIKGSKSVAEDARAKNLLSPEQAAKLIVAAMENNRFRVFIGKDCRIMNALYRLWPEYAMKLIRKVLAANKH
ncbi:SDR family NAD(P)-dependent oxidoreductase [Lacrimispora indolis]|uniref:SDR family NAD(P)-dependent oxidoreductase n=1 Tax=Lacrimispora indolis TaxID=69825 RepID=UPI00045E82EF|nr:SDR family NAD(P)-dependent oxidoreductase [Lacrimispora indolis]